MDRRTKLILLIIGSVILFGLVIWLIIVPTLAPLFPTTASPQPPALPSEITPQQGAAVTNPAQTQPSDAAVSGVAAFEPTTSPDRGIIMDLSRRAGNLSERLESGSSANGFTNYDDASLDVSTGLAAKFAALKKEMQKAHPSTGKLYLTVARRLVEMPENDSVISGSTFNVVVQIQVQVTDDTNVTTEYREATVTFMKSGADWVVSGYNVKPFTP